MKKVVLSVVVVLIPLFSFAQNSAIDKLFNKYGGKDGFTTVTISQGLLKMAAQLDKDDEDLKALAGIKSIKILAVEDEAMNSGINLYKEAMSSLKSADYEELMNVNSSDGDVVFLAKRSGDRISELILLVGGKEDNAVIYIAGDISLKDVGKISKSVQVDGNIKLPGL